MRIAAAVVAAVAALGACRSTKRPTPPATVEVVQLAPAALVAESSKLDRAVIPGTEGDDRATVVALPAGRRAATIHLLGVRDDATGALVEVELSAAMQPTHDGILTFVRIDDRQQPGTQLAAAALVASQVVAETLGKPLADFALTTSVADGVDGPSGSAMYAACYLALLLDRPIAPDAVITGSIRPDGTIGLVGDVAAKIELALAGGKTKIGVPPGQLRTVDAATGQTMDLTERARARGAQVIEVADIRDAFALVTGTTMPWPRAVLEAEMAVPPEVDVVLETKYQAWHDQLAAALPDASGRPADLTELERWAFAEARDAELAHADGRLDEAHRHVVIAWSAGIAARAVREVVALARTGDRDAIAARFDAEIARPPSIRNLSKAPSLTSAHEQLAFAVEFQTHIAAIALHHRATIEQLPAARARLLELMAEPTARDAQDGREARMTAAIVPALLGTTIATAAMLARAGPTEPIASGATAAGAELAAVDALTQTLRDLGTTQRMANDALILAALDTPNVGLDEVERRLTEGSNPYLYGRIALPWASLDGLPPELRAAWGDDAAPTRFAMLAAASMAYHQLAEFDVSAAAPEILDAADRAEVDREITPLLIHAERRAREHARVAQVLTGAIPIAARRAYARARTSDVTTLEGKLDALSSYGRSSEASRLVVMLARIAPSAATSSGD